MLYHLAGATIQVANLVKYNWHLHEDGNWILQVLFGIKHQMFLKPAALRSEIVKGRIGHQLRPSNVRDLWFDGESTSVYTCWLIIYNCNEPFHTEYLQTCTLTNSGDPDEM